jgi:hypothetical protein
MRVKLGLSCTAVTCAGAALASVTSCFSNSSGGGAEPDASIFDTSTGDVYVPSYDAGDVIVTTMDAGLDAPADALPDAPAEAGCAPRAITGFQVPPYVHAQSQMFGCNIDSEDYWFAQQCFGDAATLETCADFADSGLPDGGPEAGPVIVDQTCPACLVTPEDTDAGTYGPAIQGAVVVPNIAGCIELADQSDAGLGCAMTVQAAAACVEYACKSSCPVTNDLSRAAYLACSNSAATGVCATYTQAATLCIGAEIGDSGASNVGTYCFSSTDPATQYGEIAEYFCTS